ARLEAGLRPRQLEVHRQVDQGPTVRRLHDHLRQRELGAVELFDDHGLGELDCGLAGTRGNGGCMTSSSDLYQGSYGSSREDFPPHDSGIWPWGTGLDHVAALLCFSASVTP